jgi:hypothetical protein
MKLLVCFKPMRLGYSKPEPRAKQRGRVPSMGLVKPLSVKLKGDPVNSIPSFQHGSLLFFDKSPAQGRPTVSEV